MRYLFLALGAFGFAIFGWTAAANYRAMDAFVLASGGLAVLSAVVFWWISETMRPSSGDAKRPMRAALLTTGCMFFLMISLMAYIEAKSELLPAIKLFVTALGVLMAFAWMAEILKRVGKIQSHLTNRKGGGNG